MVGDTYRDQVRLLVQVLPFIAEEKSFALKGGTAINLFVRDLPRLSVDIDLAYLPLNDRAEALDDIQETLRRIATTIEAGVPGAKVQEGILSREKTVCKLIVQNKQRIRVKIEVTPVLRGCVYEPEMRTVSPRVEALFGFAETTVVSFADLFGGKIVAALDRQHPRDLFDVRDLLANEGIDDDLRRAFIVYLLSHDRPMNEVITANRKDIALEYERGFAGMTEQPITLNELLETREEMIQAVIGNMPEEHRRFLISFEQGEPMWPLLGLDKVAELPAVRWRQINLDKLGKTARLELVEKLKKALGI